MEDGEEGGGEAGKLQLECKIKKIKEKKKKIIGIRT